MVAEIKITYEGKSILEAIRIAGEEFQAGLGKIVLRSAQHFGGHIKRQIHEKLAKDPTGALAQSVRAEMLSISGEVVGAIARPNKPYARVQDEGETIYPKKKFLAVPAVAYGIKGAIKPPRGKWPRDYGSKALSFTILKGAGPALIDRSGAPIFMLRRKVTITGVHYMDAADEKGRPGAEKIVEERLAELLKKALKRTPRIKPDAS